MITCLFPNVHKASGSSGQNKQNAAHCVDFFPEVRPSYSLPNDIQSDLRYCLAKAIAIDEKVDLLKKYRINDRLFMPIDYHSKRLNTLMIKVNQKLTKKKFNNIPLAMSIKFEDELFGDSDAEFLRSINELNEWNITCLKGGIEFIFNLNNNTYSAQFKFGKAIYYDEDYANISIKIIDDLIVNFNISIPR